MATFITVFIILVVVLGIVGWIADNWEGILGCLTLLVIAGVITAILNEESRPIIIILSLFGVSILCFVTLTKKLFKKSKAKKESQRLARLDFYVLLLMGSSEKWQILGESLQAVQRAINFENQALAIQDKYSQLDELRHRKNRYKQEKKILECETEMSNLSSQIMTMLNQMIAPLEKDKEIKELRKEYQAKLQEAEIDFEKFQGYQNTSKEKLSELERIKANCEYLMQKEHGEGLRQEYQKVCEYYEHALYAKTEIAKIVEAQKRRISQIVHNMRDHIINKKTLGQIMQLSLSSPEDDGVLCQARAIMELIDREWAFDQKLNA